MFKFFKKKPKYPTKNNPTTFEIHSGWGDNISWLNTEQFNNYTEDTIFKVYGHLPFEFPEVGDLLEGYFESGEVMFKFIKVQRKSDPRDMFFAEVVLHEG